MPKEENIDDYNTMSEEDLEQWIATSKQVIYVLKDENQEVYERIYKEFVNDLTGLQKEGRITADDCEDILEGL